MPDTENYSDWTSCEVFGHNFVESEETPGHFTCTDCYEEYDRDENL